MCTRRTSSRPIATLPPYLVDTPRIVSQTVDQDDWSELAEMWVE